MKTFKFLIVEFMPICLALLVICIALGTAIFVTVFGLGLYMLVSFGLLYFGLSLCSFWSDFLKADQGDSEK